MNRRDFIKTSASVGLSAVSAVSIPTAILGMSELSEDSKPAILGGTPFPYNNGPSWPILQGEEKESILKVLETGNWCRSGSSLNMNIQFEEQYAQLCGSKHCIATNSGTSALVASLAALETGPGDEVITSPYTFIATVNCILAHYALPVLADVDIESFQLDASRIESLITENTKACIPVHIGGAPANLDAVFNVCDPKNIPVIEDACQAHFGEWNGKKLGSLGKTGCFSFQVTKNLSCGDGGAILTNDDNLAEKLFACHNNGRGKVSSLDFRYGSFRASNLRMTEFQGAILSAQLKNVEKNAKIRNDNGLYLSSLLKEIPGIYPAKIYDGGTSAWHLYMFRINPEEFGLSRDQLVAALNAERITCYGGYGAMDWVGYVKNVYNTKAARRIYSEKFLEDWGERIQLSQNIKLCSEAIWFMQNQLLAPKENMDVIASAIRRIQKNTKAIASL
ncbi:MAG: DegT/DnrJ/EryC1/StrS family aminotransferase [Planctomycetia bacterium]|nr:DegT/DnrJ/EryC1/StrS family aminotransferase [Planctomycetia bacterium]